MTLEEKILAAVARKNYQPLKPKALARQLGLQVPRAFVVGTILSVRPDEAAKGVPWIQIEVKRCTKDDKAWRVGCRFVRTPPWSILLMFG